MGQTTLKQRQISGGLDGWIPAEQTWTYASADSPTFTFTVAADVTTKYSVGMKVKYTQSTVKYGIITAVSAYSAPNTTITVYGGTDYTMTNAAISANYYSMVRSPVGFPMSPAKWSVQVTYTTDYTQSPTTGGVWYNTTSINIPVGLYSVSYSIPFGTSIAGTQVIARCTLSTANNSESDTNFTGVVKVRDTGTAGIIEGTHTVYREKVLELTSKATYYLNTSTDVSANTSVRGSTVHPVILKATCAYL